MKFLIEKGSNTSASKPAERTGNQPRNIHFMGECIPGYPQLHQPSSTAGLLRSSRSARGCGIPTWHSIITCILMAEAEA